MSIAPTTRTAEQSLLVQRRLSRRLLLPTVTDEPWFAIPSATYFKSPTQFLTPEILRA